VPGCEAATECVPEEYRECLPDTSCVPSVDTSCLGSSSVSIDFDIEGGAGGDAKGTKGKKGKKGEKVHEESETEKKLTADEHFELRHKPFSVNDLLPPKPEPSYYSTDGTANPENIPTGEISHVERLLKPLAGAKHVKKPKKVVKEGEEGEEGEDDEEEEEEKTEKEHAIEEDKAARVERVKAFQDMATMDGINPAQYHMLPEVLKDMYHEEEIVLGTVHLTEITGLPCSTSDIKLFGDIEVTIVKDKESGVVRLHFSSAEGQMAIRAREQFEVGQTILKTFSQTMFNLTETTTITKTAKYDFEYESKFDYVNQYHVLPVHDHVIDAMCFKANTSEIKAIADNDHSAQRDGHDHRCVFAMCQCLDPYICCRGNAQCTLCDCCPQCPTCPNCCSCACCPPCPNCCACCKFDCECCKCECCKCECCQPCWDCCVLCIPCYKCCAVNCPPCVKCFKCCHLAWFCKFDCQVFKDCLCFCEPTFYATTEGFDKANTWSFDASQVVGKDDLASGQSYTKEINGVNFDITTAKNDTAMIIVHYRSVLDGKVRRLDMKTDPTRTSYVHCKKFVLALAQHRSVWDTTARGAWDAPPVRPTTHYHFKDHLPDVSISSGPTSFKMPKLW